MVSTKIHKNNLKLITLPKHFVNKIDEKLNPYYNNKEYKRSTIMLQLKNLFTLSARSRDNRAVVYSPINKSIVGLYTYKILNLLLEKDIIYTDNTFRPSTFGGLPKSKHYWINSDLFDYQHLDDIIEMEDIYLENHSFVKRTYDAYNMKIEKARLALKEYPEIKEVLEKGKFDIPEATKFLKEKLKSGEINYHYFLYMINLMNDINNRDYFIVLSIKSGRLYHSLATVLKGLRRFFKPFDEITKKIVKDEIVEIDLKTSQLYFLANFLKHRYKTDDGVQKFVDIILKDDIYEYVKTEFIKYNGSETYMDRKLTKNKNGVVIKNEKIYKTITSRKDVKKLLISFLYKSNRGFHPLSSFIRDHFGNLYHILNAIRKNQSLASIMQRKEANVFLKAFKELVKNNIWCYPVHDSIVTIKSNFKVVKSVLEKHFKLNNYENYILNVE